MLVLWNGLCFEGLTSLNVAYEIQHGLCHTLSWHQKLADGLEHRPREGFFTSVPGYQLQQQRLLPHPPVALLSLQMPKQPLQRRARRKWVPFCLKAPAGQMLQFALT